MQTLHVSINDIRSRILGADYYPFHAGTRIGPRLPYAHTFIYIKSGRGLLTIGQSEYKAEPRDLFYIEPGTAHAFAADDHDPMVHASVYFDLLWNSTPKPKGDKRLNESRFAAYKPEQSAARVRFTEKLRIPDKIAVPAGADWLEPYLSVIHHFDSAEVGAELHLRSLFESFLTGFVRFLAYPFSPNDPRIRKIIDWMRSHLQAAFVLSDWADTLQLSEAYLYELFRKETGVSPGQYYMQCRLEQAKTELRETNVSVTLIAEKLGFSSVHYFSRQFSGYYNESPNQYRKRIRGNSYTE